MSELPHFSSAVVSHIVAALAIALLFVYGTFANEYRIVAREAKRINSTSNSPIYDQLTTVMVGLSAVRAYSRQKLYENRMYKFIDENAKSDWIMAVSSRWLSVRMGKTYSLFA